MLQYKREVIGIPLQGGQGVEAQVSDDWSDEKFRQEVYERITGTRFPSGIYTDEDRKRGVKLTHPFFKKYGG